MSLLQRSPVLFWRKLLLAALVSIAAATQGIAVAAPPVENGASDSQLWIYIGTYTKTPEAGINLCRLDMKTGELSKPEVVAKTSNPSFLALHPTRPLVYSIAEVSEFKGEKSGFASAYAVQPVSGKLTLLNQQPTGGPGPCHVSVDRSGQTLLVANYGGGSVASLPIQADGSLKPLVTIDKHHGSSKDPTRQSGPFAHCMNVDPTNRFVLSADLGVDKVMIYRLDAAEGSLTANEPAFAAVPPGSGPRHLVFHPNGRFVYVINELSSTVSVFRYDSRHGSLSIVQTISTLPSSFSGRSTAAEIQIHPTGRFLYGSNRGHNSIAIYAVDPETGMLRRLGHQSTLGKSPRHFALDSSGRYLLAANQDSANVVVFHVDGDTGMLSPSGNSVTVPMPVCVLLMRPVE